MMITIILTSYVHNAQKKHIVVPKGYTIIRSGEVQANDLILDMQLKQFVSVPAKSDEIGLPVSEFLVARKDDANLELYVMYNPTLTFDELKPKNNEITISVNADEETRVVTYLDKEGKKTELNWIYFAGAKLEANKGVKYGH